MKNIYLLLILILFSSFFLSGCVTEPDSDEDGVADEVDAFPNDARYNLDSDGDGYADEVDEFPNDAKYHSDSDGDGYADKVDDFPNDARYHSDFDQDGYADEVDEFPSDSSYHATCPVCDGSGFIYTDYERKVEYTKDSRVSNSGIFNPNYYQYVTVTNIDSHSGTFEVRVSAEDNGVKMWEDYERFFIASGDSYEFVFNYDADEDMDVFYSSVIPPTYIESVKQKDPNCDGIGKI